MSIRKKHQELLRLQAAFEREADRFHDLSLSIFYLSQMRPPKNRLFQPDSHVIMLWQHYGDVGSESEAEQLFANLEQSDLDTIGVRGSELSCYAAIEGPEVGIFQRMGKRAGSIFSDKECDSIKKRCVDDIMSNLKPTHERKLVFVQNAAPLAVWLNCVLQNLGKSHPVYLSEVKLALDPFAASLSAIDRMLQSGTVTKDDYFEQTLEKIQFRVALSFPGELRAFVEKVALLLKDVLGEHAVFYDNFFQPELARPNLDVVLQRIYHDNSDLVVVFLCEEYERKEWCGLEWRAIRDLMKQKQDDGIMIMRSDLKPIPGVFGIDGFLDIRSLTAADIASAILRRLQTLPEKSDL